MSLVKQLWLAIALVAVVVFGGSAVVGSLSAKAYLEEQLRLKNLDNAMVLASMLSQIPKDPVTVELLVAAQFDTGHYERIALVDPQGLTLVERSGTAVDGGAPGWFAALLPLEAAPGVAQVQDGWKQYGTLSVTSEVSFAYRELWRGTLLLLGWFGVATVLTGFAGTVLLRLILRPLEGVVRQAEAIGARRFVTTEEPKTAEFRAVVRSMNALTQRIRRMLEEETSRLERLRLSLHTDPVSGLFNREHFLARVDAVLLREDADAQGAFAILRLVDLQELNRAHGWSVVDAFVDRFGSALDRMAPPGTEWFAGRLNGSEFGLFAPMQLDPAALAERILETLAMVARELGLESAYRVAVGATDYHHQDRVGDVLARADAALTGASRGGAVVEIIPSVRTAVHLAQPLEMAAWRMRFDAALVPGRLKLHGYPVVTGSGELLHRECVARLQVQDGEDWLHAREFLPWLARLGEVARLDEMVLELALDSMHEAFGELCINLSGQALDDRDALGRIAKRLEAAGERARRLWIEVPEFGVFQNTERFRALCGLVAPLGCRIGIEHVGHQIARIGEFHDLGLDYLKIDASFVRGVDANQANQIYLRGVALIARSIGLRVIGEGVETEGELRMLIELGFDGATGPAITLRQVAQDRSV